jgi:hypothetical protein
VVPGRAAGAAAAGAWLVGDSLVGAWLVGAWPVGTGVAGATVGRPAGAPVVGAVGAGPGRAMVTDGAPERAAPADAGFFAGSAPVVSFSLNRRTTGASNVEEADRTNSPKSFASARTVLLSTPSSFASS